MLNHTTYYQLDHANDSERHQMNIADVIGKPNLQKRSRNNTMANISLHVTWVPCIKSQLID